MRLALICLQIVVLLTCAPFVLAQDQQGQEQTEVSVPESAPENAPPTEGSSDSASQASPEATQPSTDSATSGEPAPEYLYIGFPMQIRWKFRARGPIISQPEVDDSNVYFASKEGYAYSVMQTQSKQVWRKNLNGTIEESFLLSDDTIFVGTTDGNIHALNKEKGAVLWKQSVEDEDFRKRPAIASDRVFFLSTSGILVALEKNTGKPLWKFKAGGECFGSPFAAEDVVFIGCNDRTLYALDPKAGFVRWKFLADSEIQGSPVADDESVYFGAESGYFYCVRRSDAKLEWRRKTGAAIRGKPFLYRNERKGKVEDILISSYDNFLYLLSIKNGGRRWLSPTTTRAETNMHFDRALIFLAPFGPMLYGYDPHTGDRVGEFNAGGRIRSAPMTAHDRLFIGLNNGNLICAMRTPPPKPETDDTSVPQTTPAPTQTPAVPPAETSTETQAGSQSQTQSATPAGEEEPGQNEDTSEDVDNPPG